jgi:predicted DNA-binding ribbon-helix-helix protein
VSDFSEPVFAPGPRIRREVKRRGEMKSPVVKRSVVLAGHKTSVSLEEPFWRALKDIATSRRTTLSDLISSIDHGRKRGNLSSALRLFVLSYYQARAA